MRKNCTRINTVTGEFCRLEVELTERDGKQRLSICGSAGTLRTEKELRSDYREMITDYMMDERGEQSHRSKRERRSMIAADMRDFDPLDHDCIGTCSVGRKSYYLSVHSCGQIREELAQWFPDFAALFPWHLNDMHAGNYVPLPAHIIGLAESVPDNGSTFIRPANK